LINYIDFSNGYSVRCVKGSPEPNIAKSTVASSTSNIFIDPRDNQEYKFVEIGSLVWMAKNMNYEIGTSYCYDKDNYNCKKYGRLYDWNAAMKACPSGWHLPSHREWHDLIRSVDDRRVETKESKNTIFSDLGKEMFGTVGNLVGKALDKVVDESVTDQTTTVGAAGNVVSGKKLKSKEAKGTDNYGFSVLLGGSYGENNFHSIDTAAVWWAATESKDDSKKAYEFIIYSNKDYVKEAIYSKSMGYESVRCVKDHK
jgi:uncharacterized protein (TIGR02145 family)